MSRSNKNLLAAPAGVAVDAVEQQNPIYCDGEHFKRTAISNELRHAGVTYFGPLNGEY